MVPLEHRIKKPDFWRPAPVIALTTAVLLLLAGIGMAAYAERSYKTQKIDQVSVQARILASTVSAALSFKDRDAAQEYVDALGANPEIQAAALYDERGTLFTSYSRMPGDTLPKSIQAAKPQLAHEHLTIVAPVFQGGSFLGFVYLRTITEPIASRLERYGIVALLVVMTSLVVIVLGAAHMVLSNTNSELESRVHERTAALETANRQLQEEIGERKRIQELELETQARFRFLFANNPLPMWVYDLDTLRFLEVNHTASMKYGYSSEEFAEMSISDIRPIEDVGRLIENVETRQTALQQSGPWRHRKKDGGIITVEISSHILNWDGRRAALVVAEDITERKNLEQQLRQAQKMEAVGRLTGGISHDFNNLLGIIMGNLDLLMERVGNDAESAELAREALEGAQRGAELTKRMLAFARMQPLQPKIVDLNEILPGMTAMLQRTLREDISVDMAPVSGLWPARCDKSQVEDAILNLAINARDAMPHGGKLLIETANACLDEEYAMRHADVTAGDYVMLAVTDSGTGMAPDVIERAFEPFFTTKPAGQGTGLGLSMVYGFARQSGGHVKIYSELGHGTTVRLYLPRNRQDGDASAETEWDDKAALADNHETVLVVEDDTRLRRVAVKLLTELGYAVHESDSAQHALGLLEDDRSIDLLFTDVVMPGGMTGFDLAKAARSLRPDLRILLTTGYSEDFVKSGTEQPEGVDLIGKPYRKRELALKLRSVIGGGPS